MNALATAVREAKEIRENTPQTQKAKPEQVQNRAGGFVFEVSDESRLRRFLIIGTDGNTFYASEKTITKENMSFVSDLVKRNERLVVDTLVDVSVNGLAYRNSPALYALAVVLTEGNDKEYARAAFTKVVRTATHLFEMAEYIDGMGGWGRAKRKAFQEWFNMDADKLAYQAVKYRNRNGWTLRDVLRLSHAQPDAAVANFICSKEGYFSDAPAILDSFADMQKADSVKKVISVLDSNKNLPWETIPTQFLKDAGVWKKLFYNNQLNGQALVRNITRLGKLDAFKDMQFAADYAERLVDPNMIARTRLHPINFLNASVVYSDGQSQRQSYGYGLDRNKTWNAEPVIVDALTAGFYEAFKHVEPAGKRTFIGVDVSGSMGWTQALGLDLSCSQVAAAVAMTVARTEPAHTIKGFTTGFVDLGISANTNLADAMQKVQRASFGGTDMAQPMVYALKNKIQVDTFCVITDNETWAGASHPFQALKKYRSEMGIPAKLAVLGVAATSFTIADSSDPGMMDFCGFSSDTPRVLADFSAGRL